MNQYLGTTEYQHRIAPRTGILITNLGTPDAPDSKSLRTYLKEFLWDPRVIELPRAYWWVVLNLFVLPFRPQRSAALYQQIWTESGSPLLIYTRKQADALSQRLKQELDPEIVVEVGMRYGNPSIAHALEKLREKMIYRLLVLPLYPQYFAGTTGSTFDAVADVLKTWRRVPDFRLLSSYHDHPGYISAIVNSIREVWAKDGKPEKLLYSFHGIPKRFLTNGDPYFCYCHKTARLVSEALGLNTQEYVVCFQSRFGKEEWLQPYTDDVLNQQVAKGIKKVDVVCPGFSADCLETLEEIDVQYRELFIKAGGENFRYIPALNDRSDFIDVLVDLVKANTLGWKNEVVAPERLSGIGGF